MNELLQNKSNGKWNNKFKQQINKLRFKTDVIFVKDVIVLKYWKG